VFGSGTIRNGSRPRNLDRNKEIVKACSGIFLNTYHRTESTAVVLAQAVEFLEYYETKRSLWCSNGPPLVPNFSQIYPVQNTPFYS